jgi:hypothetical protein
MVALGQDGAPPENLETLVYDPSYRYRPSIPPLPPQYQKYPSITQSTWSILN